MCGEEKLARLGGRLIVFVGDCPLIRAATLARLAEMQRTSGSAAAVITTEVDDPTGYGRIVRGAMADACAGDCRAQGGDAASSGRSGRSIRGFSASMQILVAAYP